jgi:hypothetical protein
MAVLAVHGEKLSAFRFPDLRESTGKFWFIWLPSPTPSQVFLGKSTGKGSFPYTLEQGILQTEQGNLAM